MKLIFPNGEHASFALGDGTTRIGTATDCEVVLHGPGLASHHAELEMKSGATLVRRIARDAQVALNGRRIEAQAAVKAGDLLTFAAVNCRIVAVARLQPTAPVDAHENVDGDGRTQMRSALPQYVLRGVSGQAFGKRFTVSGEMTVGRQSDCDIAVPASEISRLHARLKAGLVGVMVEDMGSSNGTFINDKQVQFGMLRPGDELRLDTVRFRLASSVADLHEPTPPDQEAVAAPLPATAAKGRAVTIAVLLLVIAIIAIGLLRYFY